MNSALSNRYVHELAMQFAREIAALKSLAHDVELAVESAQNRTAERTRAGQDSMKKEVDATVSAMSERMAEMERVILLLQVTLQVFFAVISRMPLSFIFQCADRGMLVILLDAARMLLSCIVNLFSTS